MKYTLTEVLVVAAILVILVVTTWASGKGGGGLGSVCMMKRVKSSSIELLGDGTARVSLTKGCFAIIDACDIPLVAPYKWVVKHCRTAQYAQTSRKGQDGKFYTLAMHRHITGVRKGVQVDHIDRDGLNNCRSNLRLANSVIQGLNRGQRFDCKSGTTGVHLKDGKWQARVTVNKRRYSLGYYTSYSDAVHVIGVVNDIVSSILSDMIPTFEQEVQ